MKTTSLASIALRAVIVHTVTYLLAGLKVFGFLDYSAKFADPIVATGPLVQHLRGFIFGIVFYARRDMGILPAAS